MADYELNAELRELDTYTLSAELPEQDEYTANLIIDIAPDRTSMLINNGSDGVHPFITKEVSDLTNYRTSANQDVIDTQLQTNIDSEATTRSQNDTLLENNINTHKNNKNNPHEVTKEQIGVTKTSDVTNDGDGTSPFATESYVETHGGKIDKIQRNGIELPIINKTVNVVVPTVNNGTLTIQKNGTTVGTFSANQSTNSTVNIEADVQVNADWNATSGVAEILNKPSIPTKTSDLTNDSDFITTSYHDSTKYDASNPSGYQTSSQVNTAITSSIINDVAHTDVNKSLSANMGKELQDQITNLKQRGRYLSVWNCTTGLATTDPTVNPYTYKAGDYFIVGFVGTTNYRPNGLTYDKDVASTTVETGSVHVNDTYYFDGTVWSLLATEQAIVAFSTLAGQPYDNSNLASALNSKANESALTTHTSNTSNPHSVTKSQVGLGNVDNTSDLNKPISTATQTALNGKQATLTAGNNISISNNTISATDTTYTAGVGININNNVISTNAVINQNDTAQGLKEWCGTDNEYANISTKDADTLYFTFKQIGQILAEFTGYPLEITYALAVALVGYKIYGNSSQTGTPTPSAPIEVTSVGDKTENLFDKVTMGTRISAWIDASGILAPASDSYSIEFPCEGNTTYTLTIPQGIYSNLFRCGSSSSRYTGAELTLSNVVIRNPYSPITITTGANHKYIYIQFGTSTSTTVLNNLVIVEGSTAPTSYIHYGYKVPVINGSNCGVVDLGSLTWSYNTSYSYFRANVPNKLSNSTNGYNNTYGNIIQYDSWGNIVNNTIGIKADGSTDVAIKDTRYSDTTSFTQAMSGKYLYYQRTTDSSWTAPTTTNIYLANPLRKVGNYSDYIDYENQQVVRNVGVYTCTGTESWNWNGVSTGWFYLLTTCYVGTPFNNELCTHLQYGTSGSDKFSLNANKYIYIFDNNGARWGSDTTTFKAWLATQYANGTPVTIYYPLATPTTESITLPEITMSEDTNTITTGTSLVPSNAYAKAYVSQE